MTMTLDAIVPWGRSYNEYVRMFDLQEPDLEKRILGCADGPASFNAEKRHRGKSVVSVDPLYAFSQEEIRHRCPGPANSYAPFGWADLPITPPDWVAENRWTRTPGQALLFNSRPTRLTRLTTSSNSSMDSH
jgi:hypothetical protein